MFSRINSAVCTGIEGREVRVETDVSAGLPGINIVGLASATVIESKERIKTAILNSGLEYPRNRITVNLAPAGLRKNGSGLDLPIAIGILASNGLIDPASAADFGIMGELALDGEVLEISGVLPMALCLVKSGIRKMIVPVDNVPEASMAEGAEVFGVSCLSECVTLINYGGGPMSSPAERSAPCDDRSDPGYDFSDISGQETAKRALTIAAAGRHGILMIGSPGCGKTMLASRVPTIMPEMTREEMMENAVIYSATGRGREALRPVRPFRHPHHTIGRGGLIGGGMIPVPGEITLAHNGVLFLDEACEFDKEKIEALRIPLEEKKITHFRRGEGYTFPSDFQLIMASNPCPCGYFGDSERACKCSEIQLERYRRKLSGPIMDRIDMRITMERVTYSELRHEKKGMSSADMRRFVDKAVGFASSMGRDRSNADLSDRDIERYCVLGTDEESFMRRAYETFGMSPRSYKKTLKVARTIADMEESRVIHTRHLSEALSYRITESVNE